MHLKVGLMPIMGPVISKRISHRIGAPSATSFAKTASAVKKIQGQKEKEKESQQCCNHNAI
jgi:hypothetical protein